MYQATLSEIIDYSSIKAMVYDVIGAAVASGDDVSYGTLPLCKV